MKKFTVKEANEALKDLMVDLTPDALVVTTTEGKGKAKKEVVDQEATWENIKANIIYYNGLLTGVSVMEPVFPDGFAETVLNRKVEYDTLFAYAEENFPDELAELVEALSIESFGTYEGTEEEAVDYSELSLAELRAECKDRGIKYTPKQKEADLIALLEESDAEEVEEEEEEETDEEEGTDYSEMSLGELRAECKERGIKYTPKQKTEDLVALLEESDEAGDEEETEEEDEEETADYSELSLGDLRKLCKEREIKYTPKHKAEDLIAMLEEADGAGEEEEEEEDAVDYSEMSLGDLRKLCKEREIKYTPKQKAEDLVALLEESDGAEEEEEETDEEEEEGNDYSEMSLSELRAECKDRGIKYTPKQKEADLIALLEASDEEGEEEEEEESDEVGEDELDEILDEEFEDEVLEEEEKAGKGKGGKADAKGSKLPPKKNKK